MESNAWILYLQNRNEAEAVDISSCRSYVLLSVLPSCPLLSKSLQAKSTTSYFLRHSMRVGYSPESGNVQQNDLIHWRISKNQLWETPKKVGMRTHFDCWAIILWYWIILRLPASEKLNSFQHCYFCPKSRQPRHRCATAGPNLNFNLLVGHCWAL